MITTGIVRRVDDLGRVVIPREIRRNMRIKEGDPLEIFTTREGEVILKKYQPVEEPDWIKAKAIVRALYPNLQFALYNDYGDKQTATNIKFPQSIEFEDFDDREIKNNENEVIGYIEIDYSNFTEDFDTILRVLKEFFSEF
jgi:stage V sporulation protein T